MYYDFISYFKETVFLVFGNWIDFCENEYENTQ